MFELYMMGRYGVSYEILGYFKSASRFTVITDRDIISANILRCSVRVNMGVQLEDAIVYV